VEQGYQQLKEELDWITSRVRSGRGSTPCGAVFPGYGFLALERAHGTATAFDDLDELTALLPLASGLPPASSPSTDAAGIRRALQRWLEPRVHFDCPWCRTLHTSGSPNELRSFWARPRRSGPNGAVLSTRRCMTDELSARLADLLDGTYDCVDRIVLNGLPLGVLLGRRFSPVVRSLMGDSEEQSTTATDASGWAL